jgi:hypothetical protein
VSLNAFGFQVSLHIQSAAKRDVLRYAIPAAFAISKVVLGTAYVRLPETTKFFAGTYPVVSVRTLIRNVDATDMALLI